MRPTILCVDDEPGVTQMLQETLGARGFNVLIAGSVLQALQIARTTKLDLIILDVFLPDVDGFTFFELMADEHLQRKVPVIMASGCGTEEARNLAIQRGAVAYLRKPFQMQQLLALIKWAAPSPEIETATSA